MNYFVKTLFALLAIFLIVCIGIGIGMIVSGESRDFDGDGVAVINVEGIIIDSAGYLESIRKIREDDSVKAVVIRINSPGGAVAASQEIYEELRKLGEGMPVLASMGTVAASGGYYVACAAEKIYANPGTITASIGVIAQFASYEQLLEWARIDVEVIKSGRLKDMGSPLRSMPEEEKAYLQNLMDEVHEQFKDAVAASRNMDPGKVASFSDGRIVTGATAKTLGLVDEIGTLESAISEVKRLAGLEEDSPVVEYPRRKHPLLDFVFPRSAAHRGIFTSPAKTNFGFFYIVNVAY